MTEDFRSGERRTDRRIARCYTALDAGCMPDKPDLRGRERGLDSTRLTKVESA